MRRKLIYRRVSGTMSRKCFGCPRGVVTGPASAESTRTWKMQRNGLQCKGMRHGAAHSAAIWVRGTRRARDTRIVYARYTSDTSDAICVLAMAGAARAMTIKCLARFMGGGRPKRPDQKARATTPASDTNDINMKTISKIFVEAMMLLPAVGNT